MTESNKIETGAPTSCDLNWETIDWNTVKSQVRRLQMRIAKAFREKKYGKVKSLQWLLTHSLYAKLLAVKRVTSNPGAKTPGIDKVTWKTPKQKLCAAMSLKRHGYQTLPLKRIYIPKKQKGKLRPLSIPVMQCRAQQALHLLALEPAAEMLADKNAYGFRPKRSAADAIAQCYLLLAKKGSAQYILEGDIKSCFDTISHKWLMDNVPMDKKMLNLWLTAGYIDEGQYFDTDRGTPQGGVISATLLNVTLSGLEQIVKSITHKRNDKSNICVYADDFIITCASKEVLVDTIMPAVSKFLADRGLFLSEEKTKITHIEDGFDFLSINIRKYKGKYVPKPSDESVKRFLNEIRTTIKSHPCAKTENLIRLLNPKIRGWTNYHRHNCAKKTFGYISYWIFHALWQWAKRRHPNKGKKWIKQKYFRCTGTQNWIFCAKYRDQRKNTICVDLYDAAKVPILRYTKVKSDASPYKPEYSEYFSTRLNKGASVPLFK
jgi:RNA-directed DNA polymerase